MKLYYYTRGDQVSNFGDCLNPWLWNQLIAQELDDDQTTAFLGIGTILNDFIWSRVPLALNLVVFSSGVGYEKNYLPTINQHWHIYCVRGPLSAQKMGLSPSLAIGDGALLLHRLYRVTESIDYQFGFMPHVEHAILDNQFWLDACQQAGIRYIDPRLSIEEILSLISKTEILLAEAMHGAIASEALRKPWIPIISSSRILKFKWLDWCASLNLAYNPAEIVPLVSDYPLDLQAERFNQNWLEYLPQTRAEIRWGQVELIAKQLTKITKTFEPKLAKDSHIEDLVTQLEEKLFQFRLDVKIGKFKE